MQKTGFRRNCIIPKPTKIFHSKFETIILKPISIFFWNFKSLSFELTEKWRVKDRYGRVGPSPKKINSFRDIALFESSIWLRKEALLRSRWHENKYLSRACVFECANVCHVFFHFVSVYPHLIGCFWRQLNTRNFLSGFIGNGCIDLWRK